MNEKQIEELEDLAAVDLQGEILIPEPEDSAALEYFKQCTPARIGVWRSGPRPLTRTLLRFRPIMPLPRIQYLKRLVRNF
ncbi:hypothetical protein N752_19930 [Desulforamulus aquiferis]|nr:hypothetical protein [Desulforamulus aquiferis]RYD03451.1 hypothetical protein N752_19930 [Desulforamulus aquiferis]